MRREQRETAASPVSYCITVMRLPRDGMPVIVEADVEQRQALSRAHGVEDVLRYRVDLTVAPWKRNGIRVSGFVEAEIAQACVVTLDRIETTIREPVEGLFLPEDSKLGRLGFHAGGEIMLDPEGPDSPETFSGATIDVGAFAEEFFALAIDPYPRKRGVEFDQANARAIGAPAGTALEEKLRAAFPKPAGG